MPTDGQGPGAGAPAPGRPSSPAPPAGTGPGGSLATGVRAFDERTGGLEAGGAYLLVGPPGPAKLVLGLQLLRAGLDEGERVALITGSDADSILDVAAAWGVDLREAFDEGRLQVVGFRDDFELRAVRTTEPAAIFHELDRLVAPEAARILIDPAATFLASATPSQLGREFLAWASRRPATVFGTLPVEGGHRLPNHAEWLLHESTGLLAVAPRDRGFHTLELIPSRPDPAQDLRLVTLALRPGEGLQAPRSMPARRAAEGGAAPADADTDRTRLLLVTLGGSHDPELEAWARESRRTAVVSDPLEAVTTLQADPGFGAVLVQAPRTALRDAARVCRALRPLTDGALVFATNDAIRSGDRVGLLEAGADDCLSGGVDFGELDARLRRAAEAGRTRPTATPAQPWQTSLDGGLVSRQGMAREVQARGSAWETSGFAVLAFRPDSGLTQAHRETLRLVMRSENGDLVACDDAGCLVLLQGARAAGAEIYLARVVDRLPPGAPAMPVPEILSHPADRERIETLLAAVPPAERAPSGSGPAPVEDAGPSGAPDAGP